MKMSILKAALFTPMPFGWGLPLLIEDQPGTAKTSAIKAFADSIGLPIRVLSPGTDGEGAFGQIPVPMGGKITYPAPDWTDGFSGGGIVFCDEVTTAPPLLQTSIMGILTERRIGGHTFGHRVRTLGACNPVSSAANGHDLSPPLANRFGHIPWGAPSVAEHTAYMLGRADLQAEATVTSAKEIEDMVMTKWPDAYAKAVGLETSFLSAQTDWKNKYPEKNARGASRAWPSDRTWEYATLALASSYVHGLDDLDRDLLVEGFIGKAAAEAWATFIEEADLPNMADVLDGKVVWTHDPNRLDRSAAVLNSASALVTPAKAVNRQKRVAKFWKILDTVVGTAADLAVPSIKAMMDANLHTSMDAIPILAKVQPVLSASGIKFK